MPEAYPRPGMRLLVPLVLAVAIAAVVLILSSGGGDEGGAAKPASARHAAAKAAPRAKPQPKPKPKPKIVSGPHDLPVAILMYHVVSAPQPGAPYPDLYTPKAVFAAQ